MRFHAILCTRDEDDVIEESVRALLSWADSVFVFDSGSIDGTWDIILSMAAADERVKPVSRTPVWFSDQLRGYVFNQIRSQIDDGDWILRTDTDEFYHIAPPEFVASHIARNETCVYHQYFDFKLLSSEVERLSTSEAIDQERLRPIAERRSHYILSEYSEPRMCKYRKHISWPADFTFPKNAGYVSPKRIPIRHYPNRDPRQMFKRVLLRQTMIEARQNDGLYATQHHWREDDWRNQIVGDNDKRLLRWNPGDRLVDPGLSNHISLGPKRHLQWAFHQFGLPVADWIQNRKPLAPIKLTLISDEIQDRLAITLANTTYRNP